MIASVYLFPNSGMLTVFDEQAKQMPDYQGPVEDCFEKILSDAPSSTHFYRGDIAISRQEFAEACLALTRKWKADE
jgi:hypothetical protein